MGFVMATPQITLRVDKETLERWKEACDLDGTSVSAKIRDLMNEWSTRSEWPNLNTK
jgi:hypothetical protein